MQSGQRRYRTATETVVQWLSLAILMLLPIQMITGYPLGGFPELRAELKELAASPEVRSYVMDFLIGMIVFLSGGLLLGFIQEWQRTGSLRTAWERFDSNSAKEQPLPFWLAAVIFRLVLPLLVWFQMMR